MFVHACRCLSLWLAEVPGLSDAPVVRPHRGPKYIDFLEKNTNLIYPALAAATIILILLGILASWRGHEMTAEQKSNLKRDIILELRKAGGGISAEQVAKAIGLEKFKTVKLLEEMLNDGLLLTYTNTQRLAVWQLKGVGQASGMGGYH